MSQVGLAPLNIFIWVSFILSKLEPSVLRRDVGSCPHQNRVVAVFPLFSDHSFISLFPTYLLSTH